MLSVKAIKEAIKQLPKSDLAELRDWFLEFDDIAFDKQIENDANAGKLDGLAAEALEEYYSGKAIELCIAATVGFDISSSSQLSR